MRRFSIPEIGVFMSHLLTDTQFDTFCLLEASITTFAHFSVDGRLHPEFYDTEDKEKDPSGNPGEQFASWGSVRPYVRSLIVGKKPPLSMQIILKAPQEAAVIAASSASRGNAPKSSDLSPAITILYTNHELTLTSMLTTRFFTMDRQPEYAFDDWTGNFLAGCGIAAEKLL